MRQWDRELSIKRETRDLTQKEAALEAIKYDRKKGISVEDTIDRLREQYLYDDETINELFEEVNNESVITQ